MRTRGRLRKVERGSSIVEFSIAMVFLVPLMLGMVVTGMNLTRSIEVTQVVRDAGHMYARYVDFSLTSNKNLLVRLSVGLGMTTGGGNGVIYLSKVTYIADSDCTAASIPLDQCTNRNQYVIMQRQTVGNTSLSASKIGSPASLDSSGNVLDIYRDSSAQATNFGSILTLTSGQFAYVAEGLFRGGTNPDPSHNLLHDIYARSIF
jgi:hypothetical protein